MKIQLHLVDPCSLGSILIRLEYLAGSFT